MTTVIARNQDTSSSFQSQVRIPERYIPVTSQLYTQAEIKSFSKRAILGIKFLRMLLLLCNKNQTT